VTTIRDVAKRAKVSVATVSRVLTQHPSVNPAIRDAVLAAIEALQYRPNPIARTLRTARTYTLGLVLSTMRNADVVTAAIRGAEAAAREHGYALFVANAERDPALEERYLQGMLDRRVDGLLCNPRIALERVRELSQQAGVPVVVFGRPSATGVLPTGVLNFAAATEEALAHLVALGHRRLGTVTDASQSTLDPEVAWGVRFIQRRLEARGLGGDPAYHLVVRSTAECSQQVRALLSTPRPPTALLVTPLYLVPETIMGIRAAGAEVPQDVSLLGFGDSEWAQVMQPPVSVVAADVTAHLDAATRLLLRRVEQPHDGGGELEVVEHHARYLRRGSVAPPPMGGAADRPAPGGGTDHAERSLTAE
jgi:LacI family transcriptional regulator